MTNGKRKAGNQKRRWILGVGVVVALGIPSVASARVTIFAEGPASASVGALIPVELQMRLTESINAIRTTVFVSPATVTIERFDDASSAVRLWLQKPDSATSNSFELQGVIPGGVGPAFTNVVTLGTVWLRAADASTVRISFGDTDVYLNQPQPTLDDTSSTPFSMSIHEGDMLDEPSVGAIITDADVRVVQEPLLFDGARTLVFDIKTNRGTVSVMRIRERWLGIYGVWRDAENPSTLSDSWGLSILDVSLPASLGGTHVKTIVPVRVKALWGVVLLLIVLMLRRIYTKRH